GPGRSRRRCAGRHRVGRFSVYDTLLPMYMENSMNTFPKYKAAAAHVAPVFNDVAKTVEKACHYIGEAARQGVRLLAFPEAFLPGYPLWARVAPPTESEQFFFPMAQRALLVDGPELKTIRQAAREHNIFVSIGFNERSPVS